MITLIKNGTVVTSNQNGDVLFNTSIKIEDGIISEMTQKSHEEANAAEVVDAQGLVINPGFIQTHVHLCQTLFRGLADDLQLLDWLCKKIFPMEAAHTADSTYLSALLGIAELIRSGTTTIMDMGSINHEEEIIRAIVETGLRAFVGKAMMDLNDVYPPFKESTDESLRSTRKLIERWHNSFDGRIRYALAPRFVLSCSDKLMQSAFEMLKSYPGILFHTHASENKTEAQKVYDRCKMGNVEFLNHLGLLSERTCLAHCVHLNDNEYELLKSTRTKVLHCPSSNLKLGSGIAKVPKLLEMGVNVSLAADGAPCNNNLDMFQEMRLASLIQKPFYGADAMKAETTFRMATIEGAKALGLDKEVGSIEVGKKGDIVLLNLNNVHNPVNDSNIYSSIVYSSRPENVDSVMINGKWIYRKGEFTAIDIDRVLKESRDELTDLLKRV